MRIPYQPKHATMFLVAALLGCGDHLDAGAARTLPIARSAGGNIVNGCVQTYDSTADYFPEKFAPKAATQFTLEYHKHYKVLTVVPREDTTLRIRYALVQCGTPVPQGWNPKRVINVPVQRLAITHADYYGVRDTLRLLDRVVAVASEKRVYTKGLRARLASKQIRAVGSQQHLDLETLISLRPDVVLSYWSVSPEWNAPAKLDEVGLKSGALVGHWERTPLGALDWLAVVAAYTNQEGEAAVIIEGIRTRYDSLRTLAHSTTNRTRYISHSPVTDRWLLERTDLRSFHLHDDAAMVYAFRSLVDSATFPTASLESALAHGRNADVWLSAPPRWQSTRDIGNDDVRLGNFVSVQRGAVWASDLGRTGPERIPLAEYWLLRPDAELADLIALSQPALFPGHRFTFYRRLQHDSSDGRAEGQR